MKPKTGKTTAKIEPITDGPPPPQGELPPRQRQQSFITETPEGGEVPRRITESPTA